MTIECCWRNSKRNPSIVYVWWDRQNHLWPYENIRPKTNNGTKSSKVIRIFAQCFLAQIKCAVAEDFMKQKLKQNICERLTYVERLLNNKKYNAVKHGFFKPVFMAFFLRKVGSY